MGKIVKFFSLLFMVVFATLAAETQEEKFRSKISEQYRLTVTEVDPKEYCFTLSNQLICNLPNTIWKTDTLPKVGDSVALRPIFRYYGHGATHIELGELGVFIRNPGRQLSDEANVNVWVSGEFACPLLVRTESGDVYKEVMVLSDGSGWIRKREDKSVFTPGDRIIVTEFDQNEYLLINLDKSFRYELSDGGKVGMLAYEEVEPFYTSLR